MFKFSIIVPIYKVEAYLRQCVDSLLCQKYGSFEVILVDDGSPDGCPGICDAYAATDSRVKVVHKPNGGLSDARNAGFDMAIGDYVVFVDSDDFWDRDDALSEMAALLDRSGAPVLCFGTKNLYEDGTSEVSRGDKYDDILATGTYRQRVKWLVDNRQFPGAAWILAVSRKLLVDNHISFIKGNTSEDYDWIAGIFEAADMVEILPTPFYAHRATVKGSITSRPRVSGFKGVADAITNWTRLENPKHECFRHYFTQVLCLTLSTYCELPRDERKEASEYVDAAMVILRHDTSSLAKAVRLFYNIFGALATSRVLKFANKYR